MLQQHILKFILKVCLVRAAPKRNQVLCFNEFPLLFLKQLFTDFSICCTRDEALCLSNITSTSVD